MQDNARHERREDDFLRDMSYRKWHSIKIHSKYEEVGLCRHEIRDYCLRNGMSIDAMNDVLLASGEAVTNAVEHGNENNPYSEVRVFLNLRNHYQPSSLEVCVEDEASDSRIYVRNQNANACDNLPERGRGTQLMCSVMDKVVSRYGGIEIDHRPVGNIIYLRKDFNPINV